MLSTITGVPNCSAKILSPPVDVTPMHPQQSSVQLVFGCELFLQKRIRTELMSDCSRLQCCQFRVLTLVSMVGGEFSLFVSASTSTVVPCHPNRHAHFRRDRNGWLLSRTARQGINLLGKRGRGWQEERRAKRQNLLIRKAMNATPGLLN